LTSTDASGKTDDIILIDVIPLTLGVETHGGIMSSIIPRNTSVPVTKSNMYSTIEDNQEKVVICVYEGERKLTKDNHFLGKFELTNLPLLPRGAPKIQVLFNIDTNGILNITATELTKDIKCEITIDRTKETLGQEEISRRLKDAEENMAQDEHNKETIKQKNLTLEYFHRIQKIVNFEGTQGALDDNELSMLNNYILQCIEWIEMNGLELGYEQILKVQENFDEESKPLLMKIYTYKTEHDMKRKMEEEQTMLDVSENNHAQLDEMIDGLLHTEPTSTKSTVKQSEQSIHEQPLQKKRGRGRPRKQSEQLNEQPNEHQNVSPDMLPKKRGRGRPRKCEITKNASHKQLTTEQLNESLKKRGRGRPRKTSVTRPVVPDCEK